LEKEQWQLLGFGRERIQEDNDSGIGYYAYP
jgi:hypothetical protein